MLRAGGLDIVRTIQRSRGLSPALQEKKRYFTVGRGPVPRHRSRARSCRSGSPDPEPFVIRRSQTTEVETHIVTMEIAGETRSDARMASEGPRATIKKRFLNHRGGQALAQWEHRDREVSPTGMHLSDRIISVGQDRLILTRSGSGDPELQKWARCLPVFALPPRRNKFRNGVMKHPHLKSNAVLTDADFPVFSAVWMARL